ncbi:MAG: DctP family TRAP transporter solute-binding subunit [Armatimonadota bacterium]|nr:DctP family TRAP transporter solute-binding subunit [Armatimonadota bacterium]MDR7449631.1 DctP family TRAP transporter solute-binding subunit [Armatimonadota bacterium]MDR7458439.1 DctP family TRAP transporter solute-binding subunit [Armatimonadota bacterium]MDR7478759.1 DctP family TRAP transporter solute-binding subunit [Armatimonadota bacterium]MDR7488217.1 DctP family TRAP transporter solute-binding subunit [Armatimonadota bacterium]
MVWRALGVALALVALTWSVPAGAVMVLRWGEVLPPDHPSVQMVERIARSVSQRTQGYLQIQAYPAGQLGTTRDQIENVMVGTQQLTTEGAAAIGQFFPPLGALEAPYAWRDEAHLRAVMKSPIAEELSRAFIEKRGVRILAATYYGVRHLTTTRKPVHTVADLREFKLRVPENEVFVAMVRAWGAKPTPIPFGELYLALRQNVVEGQENPLPTIDAAKLYEVQKYLVLTGHILTPRLILINERTWRALGRPFQRALVEAIEEAVAWHNQEILNRERTLLDKFRQLGMEVIQPDVESFRRPVLESLPKQFEAQWGPGLFQRIVNTR